MISRARNTPDVESTAEARIAMGAEKVRNSNRSTRKINTRASSKHDNQIVKRLLLHFVGAAVLDSKRRREVQFRSLFSGSQPRQCPGPGLPDAP